MAKKELETVTPTEKKQLANLEMNAFESYGSQMSRSAIVGKLLKFSKGDWLAGEDNEEIEPGTKFVCNMDQLTVGWVKWVDNKPEQQIMGLLVEAYVPPKRETLGDHDPAAWEVDMQGKPRDPWQFTNYVIMKEPGKDGSDDDNLYTFATSSKGGLNAMVSLCKAYGKEMRQKPDQYPIVQIGIDKYDHPNRELGSIKVPTFKVVGWEPKETFGKREQEAA
jgi:hypothetical protein